MPNRKVRIKTKKLRNLLEQRRRIKEELKAQARQRSVRKKISTFGKFIKELILNGLKSLSRK